MSALKVHISTRELAAMPAARLAICIATGDTYALPASSRELAICPGCGGVLLPVDVEAPTLIARGAE